MKIEEFSEDTITVTFEASELNNNNRKLIYILETLKSMKYDGINDFSISYAALVIYYNSMIIDASHIKNLVTDIEANHEDATTSIKRIVEIPVCYDSEFGLDHKRFHELGLSTKDIIDLHTAKDYFIYMLGFLPGFPYLNDVNEQLKMDRLATPRTLIPSGSVGIAGSQTGFYPTSSPGGWNIIGRTPLKIGIENDNLSVPYKAGDYIKFVSITRNEFNEIEQLIDEGTYALNIYERGV